MNRTIIYQRIKNRFKPGILFVAGLLYMAALSSCSEEVRNKKPVSVNYQHFKDSVLNDSDGCDSANCFDDGQFVPDRDSADGLFDRFEALWQAEQVTYAHNARPLQNAVKINLLALRSFRYRLQQDGGSCREKECPLFAEVIKSEQVLNLYVDGELVDSYPVSTGTKGHETPRMSQRPAGPIFTKYTSTKYPDGDYKGMGNMPYAVFIRGGYAIHGTTPGNFRRLGIRASHGCIRLHPDDAKVFTEMVREVGLHNTWVTVR